MGRSISPMVHVGQRWPYLASMGGEVLDGPEKGDARVVTLEGFGWGSTFLETKEMRWGIQGGEPRRG